MDIRETAARYYDLEPDFPDDIPFYLGLIPSGASVLEMGCGTGRVTLPLVGHCSFIQGIDLSPAMIEICRARLQQSGFRPEKVRVEVGDITRLELNRRFDWIIAPYRVLQNLETDQQVDGLFRVIRSLLTPNGKCILNVFHPNRDPQGLRDHWVSSQEQIEWEKIVDGERIICSALTAGMDKEKLVLYPQLIYRRYRGSTLLGEVVFKYVMRCYYPQEFEALVENHGFQIDKRWGGYHSEHYGHGSELVLQFKDKS